MQGETSYWSHFVGKFLEIMAAGVATALSGYLIAQLGGFLAPSSTPSNPATPATVTRTESQGSTTATPVSTTAVTTAPVAATTASTSTTAPQSDDGAHKPAKAATRNSKPDGNLKADTSLKADAGSKADTKDAKASAAHDDKSIEALVRAALANAPSDQPATTTSTPTVTPRPADIQPLSSPVVVRDHPVNAIDQAAPADAGAGKASIPATPTDSNAARADADRRDDKGLFSMLKRVPDILRPIPPATVGEELRPPAPVGNGD
jgi:hypothetical protein